MYWPPFSSVFNKRVFHAVVSCLDKFLLKLPVRCVPMIAADANSRFGLTQNSEGSWLPGLYPRVIGSHQPEKESPAGTVLRLVLDKHGLTPASTHFDAGPTYAGGLTSSRIDYIFVPWAMISATRVSECKTHPQDAVILATKFNVKPRDHIPLRAVFDVFLGFGFVEQRRSVVWDRDSLVMACGRETAQRSAYRHELETWAKDNADAWRSIKSSPDSTVDDLYDFVMDPIKRIGQEQFCSNGVGDVDKVTKRNRTNLRLKL